MATTSEVKAGLDAVAAEIAARRVSLAGAKQIITNEEVQLGNIPTKYATLITEVNSYSPTGAFETLAKNELSLLTTEFQALKAAAVTAKAGLASETEF